MTPIRTALAAVLLAVVVSSCGGQPATLDAGNDAARSPAAAAPPDPGSAPAEDAVAEVFRRYYQALLARDFATACALNAPETRTAMLENLQRQGGIEAASCAEGFQKIYAVPGAATMADQIATTATIGDITVTGDQAAITWTAEVRGSSRTVTNRMRLVGGEWLLLDTGS